MLLNESLITNPEKRHDFLFAVEYVNTLPNGDPDTGNSPRVDPETMNGLVTDVSVKRKIRDYVPLFDGATDPGYADTHRIYVGRQSFLTPKQRQVYQDLQLYEPDTKTFDPTKFNSQGTPNSETVELARAEMCRRYFDVRMFGAVLNVGQEKIDKKVTVKFNGGQVRGPVQIGFGESVDPVFPTEISITRVALNTPAEGDTSDEATFGTFGKKNYIPYGLYVFKGHFIPHFAQKTGVQGLDLTILWNALLEMWDMDYSSARGEVNLRGLHIFTHERPLGNARSHELFDRIRYEKRDGILTPRKFSDYVEIVNLDGLDDMVTHTRLA